MAEPYRPRTLGAEGIIRAIIPKLKAGSSEIAARIRYQYGLTLEELPDFKEITPAPRMIQAAGEYPIAMLKATDTTGRLDNSARYKGAQTDIYTRVYRFRLMVFTLANTVEAVELLTQRLILAARDGILLDRLLVDNDADGEGPRAVVLQRDITEKYSDPSGIDGEFLGAAEVGFSVAVEEYLPTRPAYAGTEPTAEAVVSDAFVTRFPQ